MKPSDAVPKEYKITIQNLSTDLQSVRVVVEGYYANDITSQDGLFQVTVFYGDKVTITSVPQAGYNPGEVSIPVIDHVYQNYEITVSAPEIKELIVDLGNCTFAGSRYLYKTENPRHILAFKEEGSKYNNSAFALNSAYRNTFETLQVVTPIYTFNCDYRAYFQTRGAGSSINGVQWGGNSPNSCGGGNVDGWNGSSPGYIGGNYNGRPLWAIGNHSTGTAYHITLHFLKWSGPEGGITV